MGDLMVGRTPPKDKLNSFVEHSARRMAAQKMNLQHDHYGSRLPDDLWMQCLDAAIYEHRIAMLQRLRSELDGGAKQGYPPHDWQFAMWVRLIDTTKDYESAADRLIRLHHANPATMTDAELSELGPDALEREHKRRAQAELEASCQHEAISTAPAGHDHSRGWHPAKCKHCGKDMSQDSGD